MIPEMRVRIGGGRESTVESRKLKVEREEKNGEIRGAVFGYADWDGRCGV
jgi:hypothetical protein